MTGTIALTNRELQKMEITPYLLAQRFIGIKEVSGFNDNPMILSMLRLDAGWPAHDEVPWCSAFVNYIAWLLRLPRSKSLRARSWLTVGTPIGIDEARAGYDVVIIKRGGVNQPGADVIEAQGHVGFYSGCENARLLILGGNQSNTVNISSYDINRFLGIRRLI